MASFYVLNYREDNTFEKLNGLYFNKDYTFVDFKDEKGQKYRIELYPDFICDGLSVPKGLQWFLPKWDDNNILYNLAGCCHDFCYGSECFKKDIADDLFRGLLRDSGISRFKASTAEWCVQTFAKCFYGRKHDDNDVANHGNLIIL